MTHFFTMPFDYLIKTAHGGQDFFTLVYKDLNISLNFTHSYFNKKLEVIAKTAMLNHFTLELF